MLARYFPILEWGRRYDRPVLTSDLMAAVIVTIMLIPQSLAYAMLAGLPPVVGLYASIADGGVRLHLSEAVMDRLKRTPLLEDLSGRVFLSQDSTFAELALDTDGRSAVADQLEERGLI